jgi:hypothetical protein
MYEPELQSDPDPVTKTYPELDPTEVPAAISDP